MNTPRPPDEFIHNLMSAGIRGELLGARDVDKFPVLTGAYALILHLTRPVTLNRPHPVKQVLSPGWYVYAGSARGPGGIRARLTRHFGKEKRIHWHIDQLTCAAGAQVWAIPAPDGHECDLVAKLSNSGLFKMACKGFGSSDCRQCETHLLIWSATSSDQA